MSTIDDLLSALTGIPRLPGALCRQAPEMWDDINDPEPAAFRCLHDCRAYQACRQWADAQPDNTLVGIVAGEVYLHPSDRRGRAAC